MRFRRRVQKGYQFRLWKEKKRIKKNAKRERAETRERKSDFWNRVLIADVEESLPDLPARIYRIHFDQNGVIVFFVPNHNERPDLSELTGYLKDRYGYRFVYLRHMRDENGDPMFGIYDDPYESEVVYSSERGRNEGTLGHLFNGIELPEG